MDLSKPATKLSVHPQSAPEKNAKPAPLERFPHETQWCDSLWFQLFWADLTPTKTRFRSPLLKFILPLKTGVVWVQYPFLGPLRPISEVIPRKLRNSLPEESEVLSHGMSGKASGESWENHQMLADVKGRASPEQKELPIICIIISLKLVTYLT